MPCNSFANAFETCSSEESGQEARLAGHRRAIVWIGEEHAFLRGETLRQDSDVRNGSRDSGDPRRVYQGERQHLRIYGRRLTTPNVAITSARLFRPGAGIADPN